MSNKKPIAPKKGFRNAPKPNKTQRIEELEKMFANIQMALRVLQMGMQQFGNSLQLMEKDISSSMGVLNDLQYRTLAMMKITNMDKDKLEKIAADMKLKDFNDASDKEDAEKKYEIVDTIEKDSVVIIASTCEEDPDASIFRSKFKLDESSNANAIKEFPGKKVGDKFDFTINDKKHVIEILGIRKVPAVEEVDVLKDGLPEDLKSKCEGCDSKCNKGEGCCENKQEKVE